MGQGVGRALWDAAVAVARTLPFDELRLAADPNAEAFYERMGARRIGEVESEVVNGRRAAADGLRPAGLSLPGLPRGRAYLGMTMSSMPGSAGGYFGSSASSVSPSTCATARLRNHLRLAGMRYHGAQSVEVRVMASWKAAM